MAPDGIPVARALEQMALAYARIEEWLGRAQGAGRAAAGAFFGRALSPAEQTRLGVRLYDRSSARSAPRPLFDWERDWLRRCLPAGPARILVGGAGAGAEVAHLSAVGYRVDALEPAPGLADCCRRQLGPSGRIALATYEDLSAAVLDGADSPANTLVAAAPYDAVLLGWGSYSHVLQARDRQRLLQACDRLAPTGPILASFWMPSYGAGEAVSAGPRRLGEALGRLVARTRGLPLVPEDGLRFSSHTGFGHVIGRAELDALAAIAGRHVRLESAPGQYPHATFLPGTPERAP